MPEKARGPAREAIHLTSMANRFQRAAGLVLVGGGLTTFLWGASMRGPAEVQKDQIERPCDGYYGNMPMATCDAMVPEDVNTSISDGENIANMGGELGLIGVGLIGSAYFRKYVLKNDTGRISIEKECGKIDKLQFDGKQLLLNGQALPQAPLGSDPIK